MTVGAKAPSGRRIWKAVRDELMLNLYPLPFSTIAPAVYHVYLHPDDFAALEGVAPTIVAQLQQALTAEVDKINNSLRKSTRRMIARLLERDELAPIVLPPQGWEVHLRADRNDELARGEFGIVSTLAVPAPAEYAGTPTTRIVRSVVGGGRRSTSTTEVPPPPAAYTSTAPEAVTRESRDRARLTYEDAQGPHVFVMRKDSLSVGRGGTSAWVDVQVIASPKVSREHLRLRVDPTGAFFIQDVSLWGTSVDGVPIPPAVKSVEGVSQPGPEHPLPMKARIQLADAVVIDFDATEPR